MIPYIPILVRYESYQTINLYIQVYTFCQKYILVYTSLWYITVFHGILRFSTVYDGIWCSRKVYTSIYHLYMDVCWRYIKVYSSIYMLVIWPIGLFPAAPARLARLKAANLPLPLVHTRHTQVQAQLCLLLHLLPLLPRPPGPLGRDWLCSGGSGLVRCPPGTACAGSFALQPSM